MSLSFSFKLLLSLILAGMSALSSAGRIMQTIPVNPAAPASQKESLVSSGLISARGTVLQIDPAGATIKIDHDPIAALNWPRMVMPFRLKERSLAGKIKEGDVIEFFLKKEASDYVIVKLRKQDSSGGLR